MSATSNTPRTFPDCWGHRGASSRFPENTLASFEAAIRDGAEGIESDVHVSKDDVVVMFHDPSLGRTTDGKGGFKTCDASPRIVEKLLTDAPAATFSLHNLIIGDIKELNWYGDEGMHNVRTVKEPKQAIPTFEETVKLLMRPENVHAKFNVDVKVQNDPDRLFALMHKIISAQPDWETALAPRILLGLWHPRFLSFAKARLPYCRRSYIGNSTYIARKYFWKDCDTFSMAFGSLTTGDGEKFRKECKSAGKNIMVWTVNDRAHMMEAVRWGVNVIITDVTQTWLDLRAALQADYDNTGSKYGRSFLWTTLGFYTPILSFYSSAARAYLEKVAGPFDDFVTPQMFETNA